MDLARVICLIIGLFLCILGIVVSAKRKNNRNALYYAALIEFLSHFVLLLPYQYGATPKSYFRAVESLFETFLVSITKYSGEGYDPFLFESADPVTAVFNSCYNILFTLTNILMLVFAANIILHLVEGPYQELKLYRKKSGKVCLFSECNDKTLSIAESISADPKNDAVLVFAASEEDMSDAQKEAVRKIDAIHMELSVEDVYSHLNGKSREIEVFLFGDEEDKNVSQMAAISKGEVRSYVRIFAEVNALPWSLYDDYIKKRTSEENGKNKGLDGKKPKLTINLVRTEENFIYNMLLDESIFEDASSDTKGNKNIKILIVGYNDRNFEFLKAVLHLGQMPGYELSVVLIEDGDHRDVIKQKIPELYEKGGGFGDADYSFKHVTGMPYDSARFDDYISREYSGFTYAFVNIGDDLGNLDIATRLNTCRCRENAPEGFRILVNIEKREICDKNSETEDSDNSSKLNKNLTKNMRFVGGIHEVYDFKFITMSAIEKATIAIHESRYKDKTWEEYCNNEYNRHSVYARTLSFAYKVKLIDENEKTRGQYDLTYTDHDWIVYEHMRWDMYTRTLGYAKPSESILSRYNGKIPGDERKVLKVHECLVTFDLLPEDEKGKDKLDMNEVVVKALKSCIKENRSK